MSYSFQSSQIQNSLAVRQLPLFLLLTLIQKYEIVKPIGRGAGSFVYKIKERKTGKFAVNTFIQPNRSHIGHRPLKLLKSVRKDLPRSGLAFSTKLMYK